MGDNKEALDKLQVAVDDFIKGVSDDEEFLIVGAAIVYETTRYESDGQQTYKFGHKILEPTTLAGGVGLMRLGLQRLTNFYLED